MKNPDPSVSPSIALISSVMGPNDTGWAMVSFFSASLNVRLWLNEPTFPFSAGKYFILSVFVFNFKSVPLSSPRPESRTKPCFFCGFFQQPPKWALCVYSCSPLICKIWQFSFDSGRALWLRTDFWRKKVLNGFTNWLHNGDYSWLLSLGKH